MSRNRFRKTLSATAVGGVTAAGTALLWAALLSGGAGSASADALCDAMRAQYGPTWPCISVPPPPSQELPSAGPTTPGQPTGGGGVRVGADTGPGPGEGNGTPIVPVPGQEPQGGNNTGQPGRTQAPGTVPVQPGAPTQTPTTTTTGAQQPPAATTPTPQAATKTEDKAFVPSLTDDSDKDDERLMQAGLIAAAAVAFVVGGTSTRRNAARASSDAGATKASLVTGSSGPGSGAVPTVPSLLERGGSIRGKLGNSDLVLINDPTSPKSYAFDENVPPGGRIRINPDGSATVLDKNGKSVKEIGKPWAYDALGRPQKTWYTVEDGKLVQHVDAADNALYPILADPPAFTPGVTPEGDVSPPMPFPTPEPTPAPPTPQPQAPSAPAPTSPPPPGSLGNTLGGLMGIPGYQPPPKPQPTNDPVLSNIGKLADPSKSGPPPGTVTEPPPTSGSLNSLADTLGGAMGVPGYEPPPQPQPTNDPVLSNIGKLSSAPPPAAPKAPNDPAQQPLPSWATGPKSDQPTIDLPIGMLGGDPNKKMSDYARKPAAPYTTLGDTLNDLMQTGKPTPRQLEAEQALEPGPGATTAPLVGPDGKPIGERQILPNGQSRDLLRDSDGGTTVFNSDGTMLHYYSNGVTETITVDPTTGYRLRVITDPSTGAQTLIGTTESGLPFRTETVPLDPNSHTTIDTPDGPVRVTNHTDGTSTATGPDGTTVNLNPDGTIDKGESGGGFWSGLWNTIKGPGKRITDIAMSGPRGMGDAMNSADGRGSMDTNTRLREDLTGDLAALANGIGHSMSVLNDEIKYGFYGRGQSAIANPTKHYNRPPGTDHTPLEVGLAAADIASIAMGGRAALGKLGSKAPEATKGPLLPEGTPTGPSKPAKVTQQHEFPTLKIEEDGTATASLSRNVSQVKKTLESVGKSVVPAAPETGAKVVSGTGSATLAIAVAMAAIAKSIRVRWR